MPLAISRIIDISLELDDSKNFGMRTPAGFKKDLQFQMEILKEHDAPRRERGRSCAACTCDCMRAATSTRPSTTCKGGKQVQDLPLETFIGDAVVADLRHLVPGKAITAEELERAVGAASGAATAFCCAPIINNTYMIDGLEKRVPYLRHRMERAGASTRASCWSATTSIMAMTSPARRASSTLRAPSAKHGIVTLPYLNNLDRIPGERVTLVALAAQARRRGGVAGTRRGPGVTDCVQRVDDNADTLSSCRGSEETDDGACWLRPRSRRHARCERAAAQGALSVARLITMVVPITAGTTIDILARLYARELCRSGSVSRSSSQIVRAPAASSQRRRWRARLPTATPCCLPIPGMPSWER